MRNQLKRIIGRTEEENRKMRNWIVQMINDGNEEKSRRTDSKYLFMKMNWYFSSAKIFSHLTIIMERKWNGLGCVHQSGFCFDTHEIRAKTLQNWRKRNVWRRVAKKEWKRTEIEFVMRRRHTTVLQKEFDTSGNNSSWKNWQRNQRGLDSCAWIRFIEFNMIVFGELE